MWWSSSVGWGGVHLANLFNNQTDGMRQDVKVKRANFVNKNIELNQESSFSHPLTKVKMNLIFNFTGSPLWDHCYIIEPISQTKHLKTVLLERFLSFLEQIRKSKKNIPKQLLSFIKNDTRSTTGSNLRNILLSTDKFNIDELRKDDVKVSEGGWKQYLED